LSVKREGKKGEEGVTELFFLLILPLEEKSGNYRGGDHEGKEGKRG